MGCCQSTPKADQADPAQTTTQVLPWRTAAVVVQWCFLLPLSMPSLDPQESQLGVWLSEPGSSAASGGGSKAGASRTRSCTRTCGQHDCPPEGTNTSQTRWGRLHPSSSWNLQRACCRGPEGQQAAAAAAPCVHSSARAPPGELLLHRKLQPPALPPVARQGTALGSPPAVSSKLIRKSFIEVGFRAQLPSSTVQPAAPRVHTPAAKGAYTSSQAVNQHTMCWHRASQRMPPHCRP